MAKLKAQGQSSGSGVYTLKTGTSNSNFDLTLPDVTGTLVAGYSSSTGDVAITGNLVISTSGKGIDFSATAGTGTSEVLDDYEEGTWNPYAYGSTTAGSYSSVARYGYYTKIGRMVTITGYYYGASGTGAGNLILGGLPYTPNSFQQVVGEMQINAGLSGYPVGKNLTFMTGSGSTLNTRAYDGAGYGNVPYPTLCSYLRFNISYYV
jgi:hypothetical protein